MDKEEILPVDSVVRIVRSNEFAIIRERVFYLNGAFSHYKIEVEDKKGIYALFPGNVAFELECLPIKKGS